ncbi:Uncharacterised protein [Klebsiella pneumoniae]|nr:Uncharacterised protein [Klebsiella pneumoniae]
MRSAFDRASPGMGVITPDEVVVIMRPQPRLRMAGRSLSVS